MSNQTKRRFYIQKKMDSGKDDSVKDYIEGIDLAHIAMMYFHTDLCAPGHGDFYEHKR